MNENVQIFDDVGNQLDLDDVQRVNLICFKCTNYLTEKGGILFENPSKSYSDNVDIVKKFHLCKDCVRQVLIFCGAVNFD